LNYCFLFQAEVEIANNGLISVAVRYQLALLMLSRFRRYCLYLSLIITSLFLAERARSASQLERKEPAFAKSADDPVLINTIANLAPAVRTEEARRVTECAYNTGRDLQREWRVVWPPGLQNFLVNTGRRKGGLCFQFATELLVRLDRLKLETIELHWAESFNRTLSEHNVIVVTAKGQPFEQGIILDNWRYGGRLVWGPVTSDPHYQWLENKNEIPRRLKKPIANPG
jgi:hypothetical protein